MEIFECEIFDMKSYNFFSKIFLKISRLVSFDIFSMKSWNRSNRIERDFFEKAEITKTGYAL